VACFNAAFKSPQRTSSKMLSKKTFKKYLSERFQLEKKKQLSTHELILLLLSREFDVLVKPFQRIPN
jgi:hypothetical protein